MSKKNKNPKQASTQASEKSFKVYDYSLRFAFILSLYLIVLASLKHQAGVNYTEVFAIIAIVLSAKYTSLKFFKDQNRIFTKDEKFKLICSSWAITWFVTSIITVLSTALFAGKDALNKLILLFSSMPTLTFIFTILTSSVVVFILLFIAFGFQAQREFESFKKEKEQKKTKG